MTAPEIAPADAELLDRLAAHVADRRLEAPALLALESARPLSVIAGQAMVFFEPFVQAFFRMPDYRRLALLVERRECLERLAERIEARASEREAAARAGEPGRSA